jgi:mono/diheme cytochrome c family protein
MKKYMLTAITIASVAFALPAIAQDDDPMPLPDAANVQIDFLRDIKPILNASCVDCHGEETQKSDYRIDSRAAAIKGGSEGAAIIPGDGAGSRLIHTVLGTDEWIGRMPSKGDLLTSEQVALLRAWIDQDVAWAGGDLAPAAASEEAGEAGEAAPTKGTVEGLSTDWVVEATHQKGPLGTWTLATDDADDDTYVSVEPNHVVSSTYNLLWTAKQQFKNGKLSVKLKSNTGEEDQGGGLIWRAKDKDNYYVARFNPLEDNFRFYRVKEGKREAIVGADYKVEHGKWTTLTVLQDGNSFTAYLDAEKLLEATDDTFTEVGGIGYWTKADAATSFSEIEVFEE